MVIIIQQQQHGCTKVKHSNFTITILAQIIFHIICDFGTKMVTIKSRTFLILELSAVNTVLDGQPWSWFIYL